MKKTVKEEKSSKRKAPASSSTPTKMRKTSSQLSDALPDFESMSDEELNHWRLSAPLLEPPEERTTIVKTGVSAYGRAASDSVVKEVIKRFWMSKTPKMKDYPYKLLKHKAYEKDLRRLQKLVYGSTSSAVSVGMAIGYLREMLGEVIDWVDFRQQVRAAKVAQAKKKTATITQAVSASQRAPLKIEEDEEDEEKQGGDDEVGEGSTEDDEGEQEDEDQGNLDEELGDEDEAEAVPDPTPMSGVTRLSPKKKQKHPKGQKAACSESQTQKLTTSKSGSYMKPDAFPQSVVPKPTKNSQRELSHSGEAALGMRLPPDPSQGEQILGWKTTIAGHLSDTKRCLDSMKAELSTLQARLQEEEVLLTAFHKMEERERTKVDGAADYALTMIKEHMEQANIIKKEVLECTSSMERLDTKYKTLLSQVAVLEGAASYVSTQAGLYNVARRSVQEPESDFKTHKLTATSCAVYKLGFKKELCSIRFTPCFCAS